MNLLDNAIRTSRQRNSSPRSDEDLFRGGGTFNVLGGVSETYVGCGERGKAHGNLWGSLDHALQRLRVSSRSPAPGPGEVRGLAENLVTRTSLLLVVQCVVRSA